MRLSKIMVFEIGSVDTIKNLTGAGGAGKSGFPLLF